MKSQRRFIWFAAIVLLGGGLCLSSCSRTGGSKADDSTIDAGPEADWSEPKQAQSKLPTIKLWLGPEEVTAEQAVTLDQIRTGMMFRKTMGSNDSMIFVLPETHQTAFWMKNCFVPLSVAYIDPDGVIQEIHDLQPQNTNNVNSTSTSVRFALETPQGWFLRHHVTPGMVVRTERGSLIETYGITP